MDTYPRIPRYMYNMEGHAEMRDQGPALFGGLGQEAMDWEGVVMTHVGCRNNKQCTDK